MTTKLKRYHLVIPEKVYDEVAAEGARHQETFVGEVRRALKLWLMVRKGEVEVMKDGVSLEVL